MVGWMNYFSNWGGGKRRRREKGKILDGVHITSPSVVLRCPDELESK